MSIEAGLVLSCAFVGLGLDFALTYIAMYFL